ncbi:MAG: patatin-like phospholipase family protein [Holosporaceae bacterium]|jgi:NTE family protein|nr:patatin-like phospholipase family protein [Holosporaceae bacterium]
MIRIPTEGKKKEAKDSKKRISIAMQGGGAHGAYTWGVLDRLLEEKDIVIEGVSGTSAGGMNAVATAQGIMTGGNEGARELLNKYWKINSDSGKGSIFKPGLIDVIEGKYTMHNSPGFLFFDFISKVLSPYQLNPLGTNPLRDIVEKLFDFDKLNKFNDVKVFLAATHVYTGKLKVFSNVTQELSTEALLATACLPTLFAAVLVKGEYYWDGGFIGNPVIYPLIYDCETPDVMIIKLNPTHRNRLPLTASEIGDRLNEITNNTSIMREMRSMHFITKLIDDGIVAPGKLKRMHVHLIEDEAIFHDLGWSSKLNVDAEFLNHLFTAGRKSADKWLEKNYDKIGKETTANVVEEFV